jgi:small subunit ribosomal protein S9
MAKKQYFYALGRRKTATAQVKVFAGEGSSTINGRPMNEYLTRADLFSVIHAPAKVSGLDGKVHYEIEVS